MKERRGRKMSEIKLKPCPFCGGEAKIVKSYYTIWAKCICCGAKSRCEENEEKAAEAWNRRAGSER